MENLRGKRLLVLGGTNNAPDIAKFGRDNGVIIVVAGLYFSNEILEIADESYIIDILDRQQLEQIVVDKKIDGIFVGGNEDIISCTIDVCEKLGLPFYASREVWDNAMNKRVFKQYCHEYGVPAMQDYEIDELDLVKSAQSLSYPVVIKPVDNCGSNGVMKCESAEEFPELYNFAKERSRTGGVTVEEFDDGFEICVYYTFVDGNPTLSSMADKYVRGNVESFIPLSEIYAYPSQYLPQYIKEVDENMRKMLLALGIRNGITSMQGFYKDGKFKFFEMGFRLGGTAQYRYTEYINGINSLHMMMAYALTGKMGDCDQSNDTGEFRKPCCTLTLLSKGGTVARIEGLDEARNYDGVLYIENRYKVGDTIKASRTVSQFHVRIYIVADNEAQMKEKIEHLQTSIQAYDTNGEPMLITYFDTNKLTFGDNKFE
ncbi:MAG: ATP-grasp domain-containing protein [Clostridia bacterium]|nr:ATP-grasp domain-containing protein [Clostridia bacterium]